MVRLAYIDPGTGSIILQAIAGAVMGIGYLARTRLKKITGIFKKTKPSGRPADKGHGE